MSFRQVYYTSCKTGLRGSPGFQVHAATPGIPDNAMQQVERLCVYVPPLSAPMRPSASELELYPLALIHEKLPDGTRLLAQSRYIGTDYSGRFGNYFAHSIITSAPEKDFASLLPIQLWRSSLWRTTEVTSTELPTIDLPAAAGSLDLPAVSRFLQENGRLDHVANFITAVEQSLRTRRKLVIVDHSDAVASWIAVASLVLPRNLALQLTFNTYVKNPYQTDVLLVGTTTDSDFGFAPHEIQHMVFLFDFVGSRFTPIEQTSLFSRNAAEAFSKGELTRLADFCTFASDVAPDLGIAALDVALAAYQGLSGTVLQGVPSGHVADFCAPRMAQFPAAQIGALIELVLAGDAVAVSESALLLLRAACAPEVSRAVQTAALRALCAWSVHAAANKVSTTTLTELIDTLAKASERHVAAAPYRSDWLALISSTKQPLRLLQQLLLGEQLGYLVDIDAKLEELGETIIGPALPEAPVQQLVLRLFGGGRSVALINGIAAHLLRKVTEPQVFVQLGLLLEAEPVMGLLESWAFSNQALLLQLRIIGARTYAHANKRAVAFASCLKATKEHGEPLTPSLIEHAFACCWLDGTPTAEEGLKIVAAVARDLLVQTYLPARLAECLRLSGSESLDGPRSELAAQLRDPALRESLGKNAIVVDLFQAGQQLEDAGWQDHLPAILAVMKAGGAESAAGLCQRLAERIVSVVDVDRQAELLLRAQESYTWFGGTYVLTMGRQIVAAPGISPGTVVELLKQWISLQGSAFPELGANLITHALPLAVQNWQRKEITQAKQAAGKDKAARAHLRKALSDSGPRGLVVWLTATLLGMGLVFVVLFVVQSRQAKPSATTVATPSGNAAQAADKGAPVKSVLLRPEAGQTK